MHEHESAARPIADGAADDRQQEAKRWQIIYNEVRRAHEFRVAEVAAQQGRLATVLAANGIVFGFLGSAAPVFVARDTPMPAGILFVVALGLLACGLAAGAVGQWPRIPIQGDMPGDERPTESALFLDPGDVMNLGESYDTAQFFERLAVSVRDDAAKAKHLDVLQFRRKAIRAELVCMSVGAVLAVMAVLVHVVA